MCIEPVDFNVYGVVLLVSSIGLDRIACNYKLSAAIYAQEHTALCTISVT